MASKTHSCTITVASGYWNKEDGEGTVYSGSGSATAGTYDTTNNSYEVTKMTLEFKKLRFYSSWGFFRVLD